jgi:hypothetical protein
LPCLIANTSNTGAAEVARQAARFVGFRCYFRPLTGFYAIFKRLYDLSYSISAQKISLASTHRDEDYVSVARLTGRMLSRR